MAERVGPTSLTARCARSYAGTTHGHPSRVVTRLPSRSWPKASEGWRRGWDSNPRAAFGDKTLSRRPRYDHFGTSPVRVDVDPGTFHSIRRAGVGRASIGEYAYICL